MLNRFFKQQSGAAAVEFAFIAPIMLMMYFGIAELTQGMMADRRAAHVASTIGDLVAQEAQINQARIDDVFTVGQAIIAPFPTSSLSMRVTSIKTDKFGTATVAWSKVSGAGFSAMTGTVVGLPAGLLGNSDSVIMAESKYVYTSAIQKTVTSPITLGQKSYLKPRKGTEVVWSAT